MGLSATLVREIMAVPVLARVPLAPPALLGVANMRGTVIPVLSVARLLGEDDVAVRRIVVVDVNGLIGLAVSGVGQVVAEGNGVAMLDVAALIAQAIPRPQGRRSPSRTLAALHAVSLAEAVPLVAFSVSGQDFALPLNAIENVLRLPAQIDAMPHGEAVIVGTTAFQDTVLPILSLGALLALPTQAPTGQARIVVVRIGSHRVGLLVDAIQAVVQVPETDIDPVPQVLNRGDTEAHIQAICRMGEGKRLLSVLAPGQLLREDITARLLQGDQGERQPMDHDTASQASQLFLLFRIGEERFGLPVDAVEEVAALPPRLTPLPKAPDFVRGLMNVRGQVIPVIDQGRRFNGSPVASAKPRVIVVSLGALTAGFIVDGVSEVIQVADAALRPAPDLGGMGTRVFDRVANLDGGDGLVLIVSPQELLDRAERDLLEKLGRKGAAKAP